MTHITYRNTVGQVDLYGGGSAPYRIISIDGLGPPSKNYQVASYAGQPGQETIMATDGPRTITIKFDMVSTGDVLQEISQINRILYSPGTLTIHYNGRTRIVDCYCKAFEPADRYGNIRGYVAQFTADWPYFWDGMERKNDILKVSKLLKTYFRFPTKFSSIVTEADVLNAGDVNTEPDFVIYNTGGIFDGKEITLHNDTTGQRVTFTASMGLDSIIKVNISNREILQDGEDITAHISTDTYLSNFWLQPGYNHMRATTADSSMGIGVECIHRNQYIGAVV